MLSGFWGPEVRNQGVSGLVPSEAVRERSVPGLSPWRVDGHLHSHVMFFLLVGLCVQISAFHKDASHIGSGPPAHDFNLINYVCNDLISK